MMLSLPANAASVFLPVFLHNQHQLTSNYPWEKNHPGITVLDLFAAQKKEWFKISSPTTPLSSKQLDDMFEEWAIKNEPGLQGCWLYYPWLHTVMHILAKDEFIQLRTNRNFYKITPVEQALLSNKAIGIVGLSVGHAVALTMATERVCGKMRLADFDNLELSNLNRIKTGLKNIGLNKAVITAREIAEIDPFIEIECFTEGLTEENIDKFLIENGKLDILIDECDSIDMKIFCRQKAKANKIPVVMETSDRGMLDVERFDLEEDRPVLHGLLEGLPLDQLKNLSTAQKIPLVLKIANVGMASVRGKISMLEVGQSISTWPQLASAVTLGGAVVTDVCRRILVDQYHDSGRYYVDLETIVQDIAPINTWPSPPANPYPAFEATAAYEKIRDKSINPNFKPSGKDIEVIVSAACRAPSHGNEQPWKWIYDTGVLYLFHDKHRSFSFSNYDGYVPYISFGAAYENILLQSQAIGLGANITLYNERNADGLVAAIQFYEQTDHSEAEKVTDPSLVAFINSRGTNRTPSKPVNIPSEHFELLNSASALPGNTPLWLLKREMIEEIGEIIGECDRINLLHPHGHADFMCRDIRWTDAEAADQCDGIEVKHLGLSPAMLAVLSLIRDPAIAAGLKQIQAGKVLADAAKAIVSTASAIGIITFPTNGPEGFFKGGMAMQRLWLKAESLGYAIHPLTSPFFLFPRVIKGGPSGLNATETHNLLELRKRFLNIVPLSGMESEVVIFKIAKAEKPVTGSLRLPLQQTLTIINE